LYKGSIAAVAITKRSNFRIHTCIYSSFIIYMDFSNRAAKNFGKKQVNSSLI
jgi:hypothetical protein